MPENPYKPPDTGAAPKRPSPEAGGSPIKAVATGLAVDIGGSVLVNVVLTLFYSASLSGAGMTSDQVQAALENVTSDSWLSMLSIVLGAACSVAGGYVCARIARRDEYRLGAVMAGLSAFLGLLSGGDSSGTPDDLVLLLTASTIACVLLGVKYGRAYNRRPAAPGDATAS